MFVFIFICFSPNYLLVKFPATLACNLKVVVLNKVIFCLTEMNTTIRSLSVFNILTSPYFSIHASSFNNIHQFENVRAKNFSYSFLQKNWKTSSLNFKNCKFTNFVGKAIKINSIVARFINRDFKFDGLTISKQQSYFENCFFTNIDGTAIKSDDTIEITNTIFKHSTPKNSIIFTTLSLVMKSVTFLSCKTSGNAAAFKIDSHEAEMHFNQSLMNKLESDLYGAFHRKSSFGNNFIYNSNFTEVKANSCVGVLELEGGSVNIRNCAFDNNGAKVHNGCIVLRRILSLDLEYSLFYKNYHKSGEKWAAAVALVYEPPSHTFISYCSFIKNFRDGTTTLTCTYGKKTIIENCCFSGNKSEEILMDPDPDVFDTIFNCIEPKYKLNTDYQIGYYKRAYLFNVKTEKAQGLLLFLMSAFASVIISLLVTLSCSLFSRLVALLNKAPRMML